VGGDTYVFAELDKNATWFLKGVGGAKVRKGDLKAVQVMGLLREKLNGKLGTPDDDAAVAEGEASAVAAAQSDSQEADGNIDPMDALDGVEEVASTIADVLPPKKQPKAPKAPEPVRRALAQALEVPTRPPCADPSDTGGTTTVHLYRRALSDKRVNARLYIRVDGIAWLLAYAADELAFQGVQPCEDQSPPKAGNCTAVAGLRLEWDFNAKSWEGEFVTGPLEGTTRCIAVNQLTQGIWDKLKEASRVEPSTLHHRTSLERKAAAKEWMTMWCAAIARNEPDEFDALMRVLETPSPPHGEKRSHPDTAVADGDWCLPGADGMML